MMASQQWYFRLPHAYCTASPKAIERVARSAEDLGFAGVSAQDHLYSSPDLATCGIAHVESGNDDAMLDAISSLAFAAAVTERVALLTSVLVLPLHHPARLAKQVSSLDFLSGGRVVCGVGIGAPPSKSDIFDNGQNLKSHATISEEEYGLIGSPGHRGRFADEALTAILALWENGLTGTDVHIDGQQVKLSGRGFTPPPVRNGRVPLWIGGRSEAAQRRAVRFGAGWFPSQPTSSAVAAACSWMSELSESLGVPSQRDVGINIFLSLGRTTSDAVKVAQGVLGHRFSDEATLRSQTITGDETEVRDRIIEYAEAGVTAIDFKPIGASVDEQMEWMERLRELRPRIVG